MQQYSCGGKMVYGIGRVAKIQALEGKGMVRVRTREKSYIDYGFKPGEEKKIMDYCSGGSFSEHDLLLQSAISTNPYIASDLYYSIVNGVSYEAISRIKQIPLPKPDFYGYRRKCLAIFRNWLLLHGKLETVLQNSG